MQGSLLKGLTLDALRHIILHRGPLTPSRLAYYMRRARRTGAWFKLTQMQRALIRAAAHAKVDRYRNHKLREMLAEVIAVIEANTLSGALLMLGLKYALERGLIKASLGDVLGKLSYIRYLGRSIINTINYYVRPP